MSSAAELSSSLILRLSGWRRLSGASSSGNVENVKTRWTTTVAMKVLFKDLGELSGQVGDNARKDLDLGDHAAY